MIAQYTQRDGRLTKRKSQTNLKSESSEQSAVISWARWNVGAHPELAWLFSSLNGVPLYGRMAGRMKREGMTSGVPDLCLPAARRGYGCLWIEMKRMDGEVRKEQAEFMDFVHTQGHYATACWGADEAIAVLQWYLGDIEDEIQTTRLDERKDA